MHAAKLTTLSLKSAQGRRFQKTKEHATKVSREHEDHIAENGCVEMCRCGLVQEPTSIQEAAKIPDVKAVP